GVECTAHCPPGSSTGTPRGSWSRPRDEDGLPSHLTRPHRSATPEPAGPPGVGACRYTSLDFCSKGGLGIRLNIVCPEGVVWTHPPPRPRPPVIRYPTRPRFNTVYSWP